MDRESSVPVESVHSVDGLTCYIQDTSSDLRADRHRNRAACAVYLKSTPQTICTVHGNRSDRILSYMLLHFKHENPAIASINIQSLINRRKLPLLNRRQVKMDIDDRSDHL